MLCMIFSPCREDGYSLPIELATHAVLSDTKYEVPEAEGSDVSVSPQAVGFCSLKSCEPHISDSVLIGISPLNVINKSRHFRFTTSS